MQTLYLKILTVLVSVGLATLTAASRAEASADACTGLAGGSCIRVVGAGLFVQSVAPGIKLFPRKSMKGHFEVWTVGAGGAGFHYNTTENVYWNQSWVGFRAIWGPTRNLRRYLPNNARVCARFWTFTSGTWRGHGDVCVKVHR
jgi:hypothetical protein